MTNVGTCFYRAAPDSAAHLARAEASRVRAAQETLHKRRGESGLDAGFMYPKFPIARHGETWQKAELGRIATRKTAKLWLLLAGSLANSTRQFPANDGELLAPRRPTTSIIFTTKKRSRRWIGRESAESPLIFTLFAHDRFAAVDGGGG